MGGWPLTARPHGYSAGQRGQMGFKPFQTDSNGFK
jgi:hypothetical protein